LALLCWAVNGDLFGIQDTNKLEQIDPTTAQHTTFGSAINGYRSWQGLSTSDKDGKILYYIGFDSSNVPTLIGVNASAAGAPPPFYRRLTFLQAVYPSPGLAMAFDGVQRTILILGFEPGVTEHRTLFSVNYYSGSSTKIGTLSASQYGPPSNTRTTAVVDNSRWISWWQVKENGENHIIGVNMKFSQGGGPLFLAGDVVDAKTNSMGCLGLVYDDGKDQALCLTEGSGGQLIYRLDAVNDQLVLLYTAPGNGTLYGNAAFDSRNREVINVVGTEYFYLLRVNIDTGAVVVNPPPQICAWPSEQAPTPCPNQIGAFH